MRREADGVETPGLEKVGGPTSWKLMITMRRMVNIDLLGKKDMLTFKKAGPVKISAVQRM